jgi:hypothetical protein
MAQFGGRTELSAGGRRYGMRRSRKPLRAAQVRRGSNPSPSGCRRDLPAQPGISPQVISYRPGRPIASSLRFAGASSGVPTPKTRPTSRSRSDRKRPPLAGEGLPAQGPQELDVWTCLRRLPHQATSRPGQLASGRLTSCRLLNGAHSSLCHVPGYHRDPARPIVFKRGRAAPVAIGFGSSIFARRPLPSPAPAGS